MALKTGYTAEDILVQRYRRGDEKALPMLIKIFHPKLIRMIAYRIRDGRAAEDIAQDCWYIIIKKMPDLELRVGFSVWAATIAQRKAIDWIRKKQRDRNRTGETDVTDVPDIGSTMRDIIEEKIGKVRIGIRLLPPTQRIVLEMFYLKNMKLREISRVLNVPAGTIKSRLFHARENLKKIITSKEE